MKKKQPLDSNVYIWATARKATIGAVNCFLMHETNNSNWKKIVTYFYVLCS